jgi:SAM-dependent methyltransferase
VRRIRAQRRDGELDPEVESRRLNATNRDIFNRSTEEYEGRELYPAEHAPVRTLQDRWLLADMLDLGVGTGRTAHAFARRARSHVGVDYAPRMVERCRERIGESATVRFVEADARMPSMLDDESFDVVMFSFNGIDAVDHEGRLAILRAARPGPGSPEVAGAETVAARPKTERRCRR